MYEHDEVDYGEIRYMTKDMLTALNEKAIADHADHCIPRGKIKRLPSEMRFPVVQHAMFHDGTICMEVGLSSRGDSAFLDIPVSQFNDLPIFISGETDATRH